MGISTKTNILIVEDEPLIRACLVEDINASEDYCVLGAVGSVARAKSFAPSSYQILLLDLNLEDGHGTEVLRFLHGHKQRPKVLILSALGDQQTVLKAIGDGADGYLLKDASPAQVLASLRELMIGESASSPAVTKILIDAVRRQAPAPVQLGKGESKVLAPREFDVLNLLARGNSYQQTADEMGIAYSTVSQYVKQVYHKLGARSKNEAIYKAVSDGIISL